jgi:two-component system response regulator CpxR
MRILLIDDDVELCGLLSELLTREGFRLDAAHDGATGLDRARTGGYDLVILDVMLPRMDGFEVLRSLRKSSQVPVLMLTARGEDVDRIVGLEAGADDYLPKPFHPRELVARIRAILRRIDAQPSALGRIEVNGVTLDPGSREVLDRGRKVEMTTLEFDILEMLMRNAGRPVSRDELMESLYHRKATPFDRAIDMHISHLRKKLEDGRTLFRTIRGAGYQFCRTSEEARE